MQVQNPIKSSIDSYTQNNDFANRLSELITQLKDNGDHQVEKTLRQIDTLLREVKDPKQSKNDGQGLDLKVLKKALSTKLKTIMGKLKSELSDKKQASTSTSPTNPTDIKRVQQPSIGEKLHLAKKTLSLLNKTTETKEYSRLETIINSLVVLNDTKQKIEEYKSHSQDILDKAKNEISSLGSLINAQKNRTKSYYKHIRCADNMLTKIKKLQNSKKIYEDMLTKYKSTEDSQMDKHEQEDIVALGTFIEKKQVKYGKQLIKKNAYDVIKEAKEQYVEEGYNKILNTIKKYDSYVKKIKNISNDLSLEENKYEAVSKYSYLKKVKNAQKDLKPLTEDSLQGIKNSANNLHSKLENIIKLLGSQTQLLNLEAQAKKLEEEIESFAKESENYSKLSTGIQEQANTVQILSDLADAKKDLNEAKVQVEKRKNDLDSLNIPKEGQFILKQKLELANSQYADYKNGKPDLEDGLGSLAKLENEITEKEKQLEEKKGTISDNEAKIEEANTKIEKSAKEIQSINKDIAIYEDIKEKLDKKKLTKIEEFFTRLFSKIFPKKSEEALDKEIGRLYYDRTLHIVEQNEAKKTIESNKADNNKLNKEIDKLNSEIASLKNGKAPLLKSPDIQGALKHQKEIDEAEAKLERKQNLGLEQKDKSLKIELASAKQNLTAKQKALDKLYTQYGGKEKLDNLKTSASNLQKGEDNLLNIKTEIEKSSNSIDKASKLIDPQALLA